MIEIAFLLVYTVIIALVAPYVIGKSEYYGPLVPASIALVYGTALWVILTLLGLKSDNALIWVITMFTMPVAMYLGVIRIRHARMRNAELNEHAADYIAEHAAAKKPKRAKKKSKKEEASDEDFLVIVS